ncbi:eukaryotic translation initiation factor 3 subunit I [Physcia stellaris]|nr:eukaryotic translation initiation factor 3 subunit I [Physcia stellaris]
MYNLKLIASLGVVGLQAFLDGTSAIPTTNPAPKSVLATFDPPGLKNLDPVASTQLIGKYESLYWNFFVATIGVAGIGVTGVFPQSSPQVAAYGLYSEILDGPANVTTRGSGSNVKSFDLNSYYFGCNSNSAQSAAPLAPINCTVRATAYKGGKQVAQKSFDFVPSGSTPLVNSPMTKASPGFKGVDTVQFVTTSSTVTPALTATVADNFDIKEY